MLRIFRNESGSVTIEATISLSTFMFAIVTILTIVNISMAQARISYALNTTAREISQYSYLYSLTGLKESQEKLYNAGISDTEGLSQVFSDINEVYNEIQNLGETGSQTPNDIDGIMSAWESVNGSIDNIDQAIGSLESNLSSIADDPKSLMFGIAKLAANEGFDLAKSRLIAAPLAKVMVQKHLVSTDGGSVDEYLKFLGVVPSATGSYIDGLDFSQSTLFPNGSNEIRLNVTYDIEVIPLLPLDFTFHFNQTAVTHGWLNGEESYTDAAAYVENDTLWTKATVNERASLIRHMVIQDMLGEGYEKTSGLTDVQLYNKDKNEFVMISSMNPLWSAEGEPTLTLADLDDQAIRNSIERLCGKMNSTTDGLTSVTTKTETNGTTSKKENNCTGASNKIVLVVPEDAGLKEKIESIIADANTNGVTIEVVASFGNGAKSTASTNGGGGTGE
ncbi:MAG TPA: hypothetical protein H9776_00310 [Candidatus Mediterraneibacter intestinipullorum]|nr:hypothetical protein [Candidatus Mediterraneibacter intestinipullorum]